MTHAAESHAETLFMREGKGPFAKFLAERGIEWRAPGVSTIEYLNRHGVLRTRPLVAHCITVDDADIRALRANNSRIAHCPKSNAKLGHGRAPLAAFLENKITVGLGSDSVASNNTNDLLEEARFAVLLARTLNTNSTLHIDAHCMLYAATSGGAWALDLSHDTGALVEGMEADLTVIKLDGVHQLPVYDPADALVFASSARDVVLTMVAGREIFSDDCVTSVDEERLHARIVEIREKLSSA